MPAARSSAIDAPDHDERPRPWRAATPVALDTNGTVREARGLASRTYSTSAHQRELDVEQPAHADARAMASVERRIALESRLAERHGRQHARRVAGVDAGLLDVLHDAAEEQLRAVVQRVDVDLDRVVEEPVDQQRRHAPVPMVAASASARST